MTFDPTPGGVTCVAIVTKDHTVQVPMTWLRSMRIYFDPCFQTCSKGQ